MPRIGWICCDGERRTDQECIQHGLAHHCAYTPLVISAIVNSRRDQQDSLTVTELLGCPRQLVLSRTTDYWDSPSHVYAMFRGTLFHGLLEMAAIGDGLVVETRFARALPSGIMISGQPDVIIPGQSLILDFKSARWIPKEPWDSHVWQLNAYRWLVQPRYRVFNLEVVYMDMSKIVRQPVALMSDEEVVAFLEQKARVVADALEDGQLPPVLAIDKSWMCKSCPFGEDCWPEGVPSDYQRRKQAKALSK